MTTASVSAARSPSTLRERTAAALFAIVFGFGLVYGTGLAGSDVLHAAAHDSRHGFSFPCH